jgi:hypothetical protein
MKEPKLSQHTSLGGGGGMLRGCGRDLAEWLERLAANARVVTVLGSIPTSSDTVQSQEQHADIEVLNNVHKKMCQKVPIYEHTLPCVHQNLHIPCGSLFKWKFMR